MSSEITTTICLVRHGETDWNLNRRYQGWSDIPLNDTGFAQAELAAQAIATEHWDAIVCSPLSRAMQTASAIATVAGITGIEADSDLRERGYGEAEGLTREEREARWEGLEWPGLELQETMSRRAMDALDRIIERHPGRRILVVCHGGLINAVLAAISGGTVGTGVTVIINTSRTIIRRTGHAWVIESINDASHLELAVR